MSLRYGIGSQDGYRGDSVTEQHLRGLQRLLVCPVCKGGLEFSPGLIRCSSCGRRFPQSRSDCFDLLPSPLPESEREQWEERQQEMEEWYGDLIAGPAAAEELLEDYTLYAPLLATLSGDILDLGGGIGIVRDYLPRDTRYTVIDPSLDWLGSEWSSLTEHFPSLETKPRFVRGIGEHLPFPDRTFDVVLALWSLNHVDVPEAVFGEVCRVLRPGGRFLVVLEDMAPGWGDIADGTFPASDFAPGGGDPEMENPAPPDGGEWPLGSDHIVIRESDIQRWASQRFEVAWRRWVEYYLTFEFRKIEPPRHVRTGDNDDESRWMQSHIHTLQNERRDFVRQLQALERQLRDCHGYTLLDELRVHVREREWKQAIRAVPALARHPQAIALACRKAASVGRKAIQEALESRRGPRGRDGEAP